MWHLSVTLILITLSMILNFIPMNKSEKNVTTSQSYYFAVIENDILRSLLQVVKEGGGGMGGQARVEGAGPPWVNPHYLPMSWPGHISQHYPPTPLPFLLPTTTMMMLMLMLLSVSSSLLWPVQRGGSQKVSYSPSAPLR